MKDTRTKSFVEAIFNVVIGFGINFAANVVILPRFGFPLNYGSLGIIGGIMTVISVIRSYILRRIFVHGIYEGLVSFKNYIGNALHVTKK